MNKYPTLKNAPITEALIDIRVKLPSSIDVKKIDTIHESIKSKYPIRQEIRISEYKINIKEEAHPKSDTKIPGFRYLTTDKKQIIQVRLNGFTFNRLHPYNSWAELRDEASMVWQIYRDVTSPESITRVALRYINKLDIQIPIRDFEDYLTAPPTVPEQLPQGVSSFLTRIAIHEPSIGANALITQALEQIIGDRAPIILDIDVSRHQSEGIEEKSAWETIEKLRDFKNKIFFNSITDKLKEMYK